GSPGTSEPRASIVRWGARAPLLGLAGCGRGGGGGRLDRGQDPGGLRPGRAERAVEWTEERLREEAQEAERARHAREGGALAAGEVRLARAPASAAEEDEVEAQDGDPVERRREDHRDAHPRPMPERGVEDEVLRDEAER